jgi:hypothetical protein
MLKSSNFKRSLRGQPREGVVHGPNPSPPKTPLPKPLQSPPPPSPSKVPPPPSPPTWRAIMGWALPTSHIERPNYGVGPALLHIGGPMGGLPNMGEGKLPLCGQSPRPGGGRPLVVRREAGACDLVAAPPSPRPALPHFWTRLPNFGASVVFTTCLAQRSEKTIGAA